MRRKGSQDTETRWLRDYSGVAASWAAKRAEYQGRPMSLLDKIDMFFSTMTMLIMSLITVVVSLAVAAAAFIFICFLIYELFK